MTWETVGFIAATFGAISLIPEIVKALRTHHLQDLSWGMILLFMGSSTLWFLYAINTHDNPLIISCTVNLFNESVLVFLKIHYSHVKMPLMPHPKLKRKIAFEVIPAEVEQVESHIS